MALPCTEQALVQFLREAKRATYASSGDSASLNPLLPGTKQLEHCSGDFFYRDIYAGMIRFVGQEIVYFQDKPIWSMAYSGGTLPDIDISQIADIYAFLRQALRHIPEALPLRGPEHFEDSGYRYHNQSAGVLTRFHGEEHLFSKDTLLYALHYCGGVLI